jgi:hypothetical protein
LSGEAPGGAGEADQEDCETAEAGGHVCGPGSGPNVGVQGIAGHFYTSAELLEPQQVMSRRGEKSGLACCLQSPRPWSHFHQTVRLRG